VTWFRTQGSDVWHCHKGVEWLGYVQAFCDRLIVLLEDIEDDRDTVAVDPSRACPHCVAALEVAA